MTVRLGSNIAALGVQRFLNNASREVSLSSERLSSGLRINKSSDDAAGLAISTQLGAASRVYGQAIRNINDGISLLNVAEGGASELTNILVRLKELAQSAANGSVGLSQRRSLDAEADQLLEEYNRILQSTSFNGRNLLGGGFGRLVIQAGYGQSELLDFSLSEDLKRTTGTGTFNAAALTQGGTDIVAAGDFDRDGKMDVAGTLSVLGTGAVTIRIGKGDGTFGGQTIIESLPASVSGLTDLKAADINGDGNLDIITAGADGGRVYLGNGNGTFKAASKLGSQSITGLSVADFNADGLLDIVATRSAGNLMFLTSASGTYGSGADIGGRRTHIEAGDLNGDGKLDIVTSGGGFTTVNLGLGDGTFSANSDLSATTGDLTLADFDDDGTLDIVIANHFLLGDLAILRGNGNGTFRAGESLYSGGSQATIVSVDVNGDGQMDVLGSSGGFVNVFLGNGNGSFTSPAAYGTGASIGGLTHADFNSDGALDLMTAGGTNFPVLYTAVAQNTTSVATVNLNTRQGALDAMSVFDEALARVSKELGSIGASQSRMLAGLGNLTSLKENIIAAASRIQDVDVASESARLLRNSILQQSSAALLGQVNQQPALVLKLLQG